MLAIIPARGGSKGLPNKNILLLDGIPLIAYTIMAAIKAKEISQIIISTDNEKIASIAKKYEVDIPFMRPEILAQDESNANDTYIYTIERLKNDFKIHHHEFIVLQPTSPLRNHHDIDSAIKLFNEKDADSVISCVESTFPPLWALKLDKMNAINKYFETNALELNRQDIEPAFFPNGAITILKYSTFKESRSFYSGNSFGYQMPTERSIDIDTIQDFNHAEMMVQKDARSRKI
jgi:CMP-N,N'-diacetyllegionaminic acid synthase